MQKGKKEKTEWDKIKSFIIRDTEKAEKNAVLLVMLVILPAIGVLVFHNATYTGFAVNEAGEGSVVVFDGGETIKKPFTHLEIIKNSGTGLEVYVDSDVLVDIFVKKGVCGAWSDEKDVMFLFENIQKDNLSMGRKRGGWEEKEVYNADAICLIVSPVGEIQGTETIRVIAKENYE
jgi:hypothetical protein